MIQKTPKNREGFTLVEVLIAALIFTIVSLIAINVFVNVIRIQRRVALENAIYEDARVMMERISREIRENTVDYEEYYNKASDFEIGFTTLPGLNSKNPYGNRYGCYSKRFYNPGTNGPEVGGFGAYCNNGTDTPETLPGCIVNKTTLDINTGQNPYSGYGGTDPSVDAANAFCDKNQAGDSSCTSSSPNNNEQNQLYLINAKGTEKTILALKEITADHKEHALSLLRLTGQDKDKDGIVEVWRDDGSGNGCDTSLAPGNSFCCSTGFDCTDAFATSTLENTLVYNANLYKGFVPISPTRTNVVSLEFFVSPLEDPRKAFAETEVTATNDIPQQPHVTIVLTVVPSANSLSGFTGDTPKITIQTTVTSRVYNEVKSYYTKTGVNGVCKDYF